MSSTIAEEGYWLTKTVQAYCGGISTRTLHRWRNLKENPFPAPIGQKKGAKARYKGSDVKAWFEKQQTAE